MTISFKPGWHPTTVTLTAVGLLLSLPIGLAVAAYAQWGDRLAGAEKDIETAARAWFGGSARKNDASATDQYRSEQFARLDAERQRIEADVSAFQADQAEKQRAEDRAAFERFMAGREPVVASA